MFGKSAFGSTGGFGQPQQQQQPGSVFGQPAQQPQQQGGAFGGFGATSTPSAFGSTPATTSAFGQPAQQSAFGAAPATTGFGASNTSAFGQARPSAFGAAQPSAFGGAQPAASTGFGGGGFGSTPTTSAFGSTAAQPSGGLFGARPAGSAFGSAPTTSAFGQPQQQTSAFGGMGSTGSAFGQPAAAGGVNQGTAVADFSPTQDRDITTGVNNFFQTITAMPQYKNYSLEELRLQDYQQNRKTATGATGGAGAFGAPAGGAFGASTGATGSAFGQPATGAFGQQQQTSAFGQPAQTSAFGAGATSGGLFGQQQQPATTSAFGQPATGTSGFGASTSAFGQPAATSGFGAGAATGGAFGAAASKPFSFGSTPAPATGGFGQPATSAFGQPAASTGAFGQQQPATTSAFGGGFGQKPATTPATGGFGSGFGQPAAATGGFGQPAAAGGFGASTSKPASSFSFGAAAPTSTAGGFGTGFGATPAPATGGFGQPATGGLFGAAKPAAPTTSLFNNAGASTGATGGFGGFGTGAAGATGATGGLFGQKPATGLGGTGGGLFGNNTMGATNTGFGFGQQQQGTNSFNLPAQGGLTSFGTNPLQPGMQQQPLIAAVDKNPYGNNPLFDLSKVSNTPSGLKSGASAVAVDGSGRKSSNAHYPISPRVVSKIKLRGFNFHPVKSSARQASTSSLEGISDDAVLGSGAFAPRAHSKKLVFDNDIDAAGIVDLVNSKKSDKRRVMFDPQLEYVAAKGNNAAAAATPATMTTTTTTTTIISEVTATNDAPSTSNTHAASSSAANVALRNDYYISPSLDTLANMPTEGLKHVQNLVVGRKGYGEVRFDQPVDLTNVALEDIMGNIVVIEEKKVVVYPNQDTKPPKGTQLNLPATVKIENCFSHDKNTGAPVRDPTHPRFNLFKERLRKRENVEFVDYTSNGEWIFKVQEF